MGKPTITGQSEPASTTDSAEAQPAGRASVAMQSILGLATAAGIKASDFVTTHQTLIVGAAAVAVLGDIADAMEVSAIADAVDAGLIEVR